MSRRLRLFRRKRRPSPIREQPEARDFALRHRFLLILLLAQVPILAAVGLAWGASITEVVIASLLLVVMAAAGMLIRNHTLASAAVALGLVTAAGILVRYLDGSTEAQFAFFLVIVAISFYNDWKPLLLGVVYIALYHLIVFIPDQGLTGIETAPDPAWTTLLLTCTVVLALLLAAGWRLARKAEGRRDDGDERLRLGFERAPIGMAVLTPSGEFLQANPAMAQILGYDDGDLLGANIRAIIHADDLGDLGQVWEEMGRSAGDIATAWMRCLTANGQNVWSRVSLSLVPGTARRPATVLFQLENEAGAHHEQVRLESLLRGKDEFVAAVGEEIRDEIGSVLELAAQPGAAHNLGRIHAQAQQVASVVDDLVVSARADTVPVSAVAGSVDAGLLCREVLGRLPGAERIRVDLGAASMWADPGLTKRIITGLAANALHFGGPSVTLETTRSGPDIVIEVTDDGPEIPVPERERIFNGDLRAGSPVTRPATVGLSLTVCRHLARLMDGDITYRRTPDSHNVFELRLPTGPVRVGQTEPESAEVGVTV